MSTLLLGDAVVWENPAVLGHVGIKLRKQIEEEAIIERMVDRVTCWLMCRAGDDGT